MLLAKAIEVLMNEHRLIEQVLGSLETFACQLDGDFAAERPAIADYGDFFREFADAGHHLYPMAVRLLTDSEMDAMEAEFSTFDSRLRADGSYDRLHCLADRLSAGFRPDLALAAQGLGCGG